jgi:two-component system, NtrC family, sensor kinase
MKKLCLSFLVIMLIATKATAQDFIADSIKSVIENTKSDSVKASALIELVGHEYGDLHNHDTAIKVLNSVLAFARQKGLKEQEVESIRIFGLYYTYTDDKEKDPKKGFQLTLQALSLARQHHLKGKEVQLLLDLSNKPGDKTDSIKLLIDQAISLSKQYNLVEQQINALTRKGNFYLAIKQDLAKFYLLQGLTLARQSHLPKSEVNLLQTLADTYSDNHLGDSSKYLMREALRVSRENHLADLEINLLYNFTNSSGNFFLKDSLNTFFDRMLLLSRQLHRDSLGIIVNFANTCKTIGNFPKALQAYLMVLHVYEGRKDSLAIGDALNGIGLVYWTAKDFKKSTDYYYQALKYLSKDEYGRENAYRNLALSYLGLKQNDSARYYADKAYQTAISINHGPDNIYGGILNDLGTVYFGIGEDSLALDFLRRSFIYFTLNHNELYNYAETTMGLANYFKKAGLADSSFYYAKLSFTTSQNRGFLNYLSESSGLIADYYNHKHITDSAYYYQQIGFDAYKTLYSDENSRQIQNIAFAEQQREEDVAQAKKTAADQYRSRLNKYILIGGLMILSVLVFGLWRRNIFKQKSFALLQKQKQEIDLQRSKLEISLNELQTTQSQLIQSEKMASLGELTAGIAHEIQNPLNFVNNFSEVNTELIDEMQQEMDKGNMDDAKAIAKNIKENEQKINHHGKRADSIVKGMLQHSRNSSGQKEPTDINALADECMRLSYHGLRAKDKSFNAKTETNFDSNIPKINIAPQDIGRVIINLFTNAFYSVMQKKKQLGDAFEPVVTVKTSKTPKGVSISIRDNGNGVPQKVMDKIFQPFFTTKPVGEGTGLGLSMSYEIITKGHNGELKVETKEGEFAEFIINLPV